MWRNCWPDKGEAPKKVNWSIPDKENRIGNAVYKNNAFYIYQDRTQESKATGEREVHAENFNCKEQRMSP